MSPLPSTRLPLPPCTQAREAINGRMFAGNTVEAAFMQAQDFIEAIQPPPAPPPTILDPAAAAAALSAAGLVSSILPTGMAVAPAMVPSSQPGV